MSGRELYKIMIKNDLDFVIDKIIEKNNDLTIKELKIEELEKEIDRLNNIINELNEYKNAIYEIKKYIDSYSPYFVETQEENNKKIANIINEIGKKKLKDSD